MEQDELRKFLASVRRTRFIDYIEPMGEGAEQAFERRLKWAERSKGDPALEHEAGFLLEHAEALRALVLEEDDVEEDWIESEPVGASAPLRGWARREPLDPDMRVTELPADDPNPDNGANLTTLDDLTPPPGMREVSPATPTPAPPSYTGADGAPVVTAERPPDAGPRLAQAAPSLAPAPSGALAPSAAPPAAPIPPAAPVPSAPVPSATVASAAPAPPARRPVGLLVAAAAIVVIGGGLAVGASQLGGQSADTPPIAKVAPAPVVPAPIDATPVASAVAHDVQEPGAHDDGLTQADHAIAPHEPAADEPAADEPATRDRAAPDQAADQAHAPAATTAAKPPATPPAPVTPASAPPATPPAPVTPAATPPATPLRAAAPPARPAPEVVPDAPTASVAAAEPAPAPPEPARPEPAPPEPSTATAADGDDATSEDDVAAPSGPADPPSSTHGTWSNDHLLLEIAPAHTGVSAILSWSASDEGVRKLPLTGTYDPTTGALELAGWDIVLDARAGGDALSGTIDGIGPEAVALALKRRATP